MMNNNLTYNTSITQSDVEVIYEMARRLILLYEDPNIMNIEKALQWTKTSIEANTQSYIKVKDGDHIIGYYHVYENMDFTYELTNFYILEEYRNKGYGKAILQHILDEFDETMYVYVFVQNKRAYHIYESKGFTFYKKVSPTRVILQYKKS